LPRFRQRLYGILDQGSGADGLSAVVNWTLIGLIVMSLTASVLESVPRLAAQYGEALEAIEYVALITFSIEYAAVDGDRAPALAAVRCNSFTPALCGQPGRADRSRRRAAVLAVAVRSG
jgi:hypothetical protein